MDVDSDHAGDTPFRPDPKAHLTDRCQDGKSVGPAIRASCKDSGPRCMAIGDGVVEARVRRIQPGVNSGIARIMNSSNSGTVNAMSPCAGL